MIKTNNYKSLFESSVRLSDDKIRDLCFATKYYLLSKDYNTVNEYVKLIIDNLDTKNITTHALALWIISDAIREADIKDIEGKYIEELVSVQLSTNDCNAPHWLYGGKSDYYLSNIAALHCGLKSGLNIIDNDDARKKMIALREYALKKFLQGGYLISIAEGDLRLGDLSMCAVPFCMFGAEDRILVESMEEESERFFGNQGIEFSLTEKRNKELTLLLSWYFAEKGDIEKGDLTRAKVLYNKAAELTASIGKEALSTILMAIVEEVLYKKENISGDLTIIHCPKGTSDPYYTSLHERSPRIPTDTEEVVINAEINPSFGEYTLQLEFSKNNQPPMEVKMIKEGTDAGGEYYRANIGRFDFGEKVTYKITAEGSGKLTSSEEFSFNTARWFDCNGIIGAEQLQEKIIIYFEKAVDSDVLPVLTIRPNGKAALFEFVFRHNYKIYNLLKLDTFKAEDLDVVVTQKGIYICDKHNGRVLTTLEDNMVSFLYNGEDIIKARLNLKAGKEEKYFGMGERYSCIEYKGLRIDNYVYNQYRSQGMKTYMPSPFYISSEGYGLHFKTNSYSVFDFCSTNENAVTIEGYCSKDSFDFDLYFGDPKEILKNYINRIGLPELPPIWAFGPWMSSNNWDSQQEVLYQVEMTKKFDIPATVLVIEQWSDEATFYIFNDAKYNLKDGKERHRAREFEFSQWGRWNDPKSMVDKLHQEGIKVLLWQVPIHKYMGGVSHPQRDEDERLMIEKGFCVMNEDLTPYRIPYGWFAGSLVLDFTNPEAREWWLDKRRYLLEDIGIDGFKTDGGECILGDELKFFDGTSGREMHNRYVLDYIGAYYRYVKDLKGEGITFSRAGYSGSHTMPMHWAGDERSTWEAFRSSIRAGISAGLSGIIFWGWDIAGFHGEIPTAELFIRSAQMAAFCPVMQYHAETKGEYNRDRTPWNIAERTKDVRVISVYRKFAILRMNLLPYIYSEANDCVNNCQPLMRAMFYDFPDEDECINLDMQYMLGKNILVSPVSEEGQTVKRVYFPKGKWHGFFDNRVYDKSGYFEVFSPLDTIPVFVKANSIIPLNLNSSLELLRNVGNDVDSFKNLCLDIRLEDQIKNDFKFGALGDINIEVVRIDKGITVSTNSNQPIFLRFWNEVKPNKVTINDKLATECCNRNENHSFYWCYKENQIIVKVEEGSSYIQIEV
ncbi:glycoside hydrolase family 31 protein [Alkaliphilus serpentinus]|nr:TIM-barrel domain-containing protein [Alkaliphilus serpentinus]